MSANDNTNADPVGIITERLDPAAPGGLDTKVPRSVAVALTEGEREALDPVLTALPGTAVGEFEPTNPERGSALDVTDLAVGNEEEEPMVVDDLLRERAILGVCGEEGEGKTLMIEQFSRQLIRNELILGHWKPGERRPERLLIVDTHQELPEIRARCRDADARGLSVPPRSIFWWPSGALDLAGDAADRAVFEAEVERTGAEFLWLDAASHLVSDPKDDGAVRELFDLLSDLMHRRDLRGIGTTLFARKRGRDDYGRAFDDLFGSREWKARLSIVVYIEGAKIVAFKRRGGFLAGWPVRGRYPTARLERPGLADPTVPPFQIVVPEAEEGDAAAMEDQALGLIAARPGHYTKTGLAQALGGRREDALHAVGTLIAGGRIGPDQARAKLHLMDEGSGDA